MSAVTKSQILGQLFKDYGLFYDPTDPNSKDNDVFTHKHYKIITRSGIEKIQKKANIAIKYELWYADATTVTLKAIGTKTFSDGSTETIETLASASSATSSNGYYAEMAEKRGASRIVLKLAGLYEYGVFGADEAKEFEDATHTSKRATYRAE